MNLQRIIKTHETLIQIIEGVSHFSRRIDRYRESLDGIQGTFPRLRSRLEHDIEICEMCIKRLEERHSKLLKKLLKDETI